MSALTDVRDLMSAAHVNGCELAGGKTIDIHQEDSLTPVTGWSNLAAIARGLNDREQRNASLVALQIDMVFEVARQAAFIGANLRPHKYKVKHGDVFWQIVSMTADDAEVTTLGRTDAAVYTLYAQKLDTGVGERVD